MRLNFKKKWLYAGMLVAGTFAASCSNKEDYNFEIGKAITIKEGIDIAIIATENATSDRFAQQLCHNKGIRVHVVNHPEMSDFDFPELCKKGDLVVGVTSSNKSPAASAYVRGEIDKMIPDSMEAIVKRLGESIPILKERISDEKQRSNVLGMMFDYLLEKDNQVSEEDFWAEVDRRSAGMKINSIWEGKERPAN